MALEQRTNFYGSKGLRVNAKEIKRKVTLKMNEAERCGNHERANKLRTLLEEHKDTQSKPVVCVSSLFRSL